MYDFQPGETPIYSSVGCMDEDILCLLLLYISSMFFQSGFWSKRVKNGKKGCMGCTWHKDQDPPFFQYLMY